MSQGCPNTVRHLCTRISFTANNISKMVFFVASLQCGAFLSYADLLVVRERERQRWASAPLCPFSSFLDPSLTTFSSPFLGVALHLIFCLCFFSKDKCFCKAILCCCIVKKTHWTCGLVNCCILTVHIKKMWLVKAEDKFSSFLSAPWRTSKSVMENRKHTFLSYVFSNFQNIYNYGKSCLNYILEKII